MASTLPTVVLVHRSCHGAWCWRDLEPALAALGHETVAPDMPGRGADATPAAACTLDGYAARIGDAIAAAGRPVILLGHSAGGAAITAAAEREAEGRIAGLVYLCAYALRDGESIAAVRRRARRQPLAAAIRRSADGASFTVDPGMAPGIFYHDCPEAAVAYALPRLCAEPVRPQETPVRVTARSAGLPRRYVLCTDDHTIPPEAQEAMVADWDPATVLRLASGHSPFLACPAALAELLDPALRALAAA
jgi:pimeloyl-ACP methyl ester carboxylesterase